MNQALNENERLLEQVMSKDIVNLIVNSSMDFASVNVHECKKCLKLETKLQKDFVEKEIYDKLFKRFTTLEKHCISLEVDTQLNQEIFQRDNSISNQSAPSFDQLFELNELKAQSQEKDMVIKKLKERIKSLSGNMDKDKIKQDLEEIETINIELDHMVTKLIAENKHLKQTYKQLYDLIKPARVRSKEQCADLTNQVNLKSVEISDLNACLQEKVLVITTLKDELRKLKGKDLANNEVTHHPSDPEINMEPITPKLLNKRSAHSAYIKHTQEEAAVLRDLCNGCMLSDNHDLCVLDYINNVNARAKSKSTKKQTKRKVWKPIGKMFTTIGYIWRPTGRTFTIVGNVCPLTRITTTTEAPLRKPVVLDNETSKPAITLVYSEKPRNSKTHVLVNKSKVLKSVSANKKEPSKSWGSIISDVPSSSLNECVDLLTGSRGNNLDTLSLGDMMASSPIYLLSKASKTKSWLWHQRLSHLIFGTINHLARHGLVRGLPKLKFENDHLCSACAMDLCGPMCVASVNGKKYIFVIIDDYLRFTWVKFLRTDNGTKFINQTLCEYYEKAKAVATACYTQNRSIIRLRHGKTPYELLNDKLPDLSFFHVFGALCYLTNDSGNLGKLQPRPDIDFDELTVMASKHSSSRPALHEMTPVTISSELVSNPPPLTLFVPPSRTDWDMLFQPLFDELLNPPPSVDHPSPEVVALIDEVVAPVPAVSTGSPSSTTVDQDAPSPSNSQTTPNTQPPVIPNDVEEDNHGIEIAHMGNDSYFGIPIPEVPSDQSSSSNSIHINVPLDHQIFEHNNKWTTDHPLENIISKLARPTYKDALTQACWIKAMQEELNEFEGLEVWELIPRPDKVMVITLKWIYKVKLDELGGILKNKARLVARGYRQEEGI
ncbi:retrovirus-related pol polyprotein from transposon TNT 1-94, partial [Tanacetum coccineum]